MKSIFYTLLFLLAFQLNTQAQNTEKAMAQDPIPYHQIPDYPESYSPGNIAARMVDGLGYRYYWATKDLRQEDLDYKPSEDGKTTAETLDHRYGLSKTTLNAITKTPNVRPAPQEKLNFEEKRKATLKNFEKTSQLLKAAADTDIENFQIIFQRGERSSEFPFWHLLNGPIADAIYHVGQIVAFRRASGNPLHPMVNVFMGKTRE